METATFQAVLLSMGVLSNYIHSRRNAAHHRTFFAIRQTEIFEIQSSGNRVRSTLPVIDGPQ